MQLSSRKILLKLRKNIARFEKNSNKFKLQVKKLEYEMNKISWFTYALACAGFALVPLKINAAWIVAVLKADAGIVGVVTGAGLMSATAATVIATSRSPRVPIVVNDNPVQIERRVEATPVSVERRISASAIPVFKPTYATIKKIDGDVIYGLITEYTKQYVVIKVNDDSKKIYHSDIFEIKW